MKKKIILFVLLVVAVIPLIGCGTKSENVSKIEAEVYVLSKDEGGRHTPFFNNYKPSFRIGDINTSVTISLSDNKEMAMPGETANMIIEFEEPINVKVDDEFELYEGGRVVAKGKIKNIIKE